MPLARFHMYAQGVDVWVAPTLATGEAWVATMRHIAREGRMFVIGVNPCVHAEQIPPSIPHPEAFYPPEEREDEDGWLLPGNSLIVGPTGEVLAGPVEREERTLFAELDLRQVAIQRRLFDPVGHYNRPDVFRLTVDTRARPAVVQAGGERDAAD